MKCARCGKAIKKAHGSDDKGFYGPECAEKLGLVAPAPVRHRKPKAVKFRKVEVVRIDDRQLDLFNVIIKP